MTPKELVLTPEILDRAIEESKRPIVLHPPVVGIVDDAMLVFMLMLMKSGCHVWMTPRCYRDLDSILENPHD